MPPSAPLVDYGDDEEEEEEEEVCVCVYVGGFCGACVNEWGFLCVRVRVCYTREEADLCASLGPLGGLRRR